MNYKVIALYPFERELKRLSKKYRSIKNDYASFLEELYANPSAGAHLENGVRKVRMAIGSKGRGKSHGARIITVTVLVAVKQTEINLLYIYDKAERETITAREINALLRETGLDSIL